MIAPSELLRVLLAPILVAAVIAGIGRWRGWAWAMPLAAGAGFIVGYALLGVPKLPPRDGTDWLFWLAIPATLLGVLDATVGGRWGWALGLGGGVAVAVVVGLPLAPHAVSHASLYGTAALLALGGVAVCFAAHLAEPRVHAGGGRGGAVRRARRRRRSSSCRPTCASSASTASPPRRRWGRWRC